MDSRRMGTGKEFPEWTLSTGQIPGLQNLDKKAKEEIQRLLTHTASNTLFRVADILQDYQYRTTNQANAYVTTLEVLLKDDQLKLHQYLLQLQDSLQKDLLKSKEVLLEKEKNQSLKLDMESMVLQRLGLPTPNSDKPSNKLDFPKGRGRSPNKASSSRRRTGQTRSRSPRNPQQGYKKSRLDTHRQDMYRQDSHRQDTYRRDTSRRDTQNRDSYRQTGYGNGTKGRSPSNRRRSPNKHQELSPAEQRELLSFFRRQKSA